MYQARKKIVAGSTNDLRLRTSSWNSGDRSIASQSMFSAWAWPSRPERIASSLLLW